MNKKIFISTAIPYVNAKPHIGFALELVQTDAYARYLRLLGNDIFFLTGTDENSLKNVRAAKELSIETRELCEQNSNIYKKLLKELNISNDYFIRTSSDTKHKNAAQKLWMNTKKGDIYTKHYSGYYCVGCEEYYSIDDFPDLVCPDHKTKLELVEEENYFFRLSNYQDQLISLIESGTINIIPEIRKNEVLAFAKSGLRDISISRSKKRAGNWGIPVPNDPDQVMYVWFDALANYISAIDYDKENELFKQYWFKSKEKIHVIGKGINRFHSIYWPAMLLSAGVKLPDKIFVHGYITVDGQKISKSLGNVIDPFVQIQRFGVDLVRYFLLKAVSPYNDGDYSEERLKELCNSDLSNNLGNLIRRIETFCERSNYTIDYEIYNLAPPGFHVSMSDFKFNDAIQILMNEATLLNKKIEDIKPWELLRQEKTEKLKIFLDEIIKSLQPIIYWLQPFIPSSSKRILEILSSNNKIKVGQQIFPKI